MRNIGEVKDLLVKARAVVGHFSMSCKATVQLQAIQRSLGQKPRKLVQDVPTRWNSQLDMMKSLLMSRQSVAAYLASDSVSGRSTNHLFLLADEWALMKELVELLSPLRDVTTKLGGNTYTTLSLIIPMIKRLLKLYRNPAEGCDESDAGERVRECICRSLHTRWSPIIDDTEMQLSCVLDPRLKSLSHLRRSKREEVMDLLRQSASRQAEQMNAAYQVQSASTCGQVEGGESGGSSLRSESEADDADCSVRSAVSDEEKKMIQLLGLEEGSDDDSRPESSVRDSREQLAFNRFNAEDETKQYISLPPLRIGDDPLAFWKGLKNTLPVLAVIARRYLAIPATSVPSERLFSEAGSIVSARRASLQPNRVRSLAFLHGYEQFKRHGKVLEGSDEDETKVESDSEECDDVIEVVGECEAVSV